MWRKTGVVLALSLVLLAVIAPAHADPDERHIAVTGEGRVDVVPDMASVTLGVTNQASDAKAAMDATSEAVARILERLTELEVETRDVQTQRFSLTPVWSNRTTSDPVRITGFTASNMVLVRIRDLDRLGEVLDAVIADGANDFNGLSFGVQQADDLRDAARRAAVKDARAKATVLAEAAGVRLGSVVSISENRGGTPRPMMMEMAAARDAGAPVAAGEVSIESSVSMVFEIAD